MFHVHLRKMCALLPLDGMLCVSAAQSMNRVTTPVIVMFRPLKTKQGGKTGILGQRKGVESFTPHHSWQSPMHASRAAGDFLFVGSQLILITFYLAISYLALLSVGFICATVVSRPQCL